MEMLESQSLHIAENNETDQCPEKMRWQEQTQFFKLTNRKDMHL